MAGSRNTLFHKTNDYFASSKANVSFISEQQVTLGSLDRKRLTTFEGLYYLYKVLNHFVKESGALTHVTVLCITPITVSLINKI